MLLEHLTNVHTYLLTVLLFCRLCYGKRTNVFGSWSTRWNRELLRSYCFPEVCGLMRRQIKMPCALSDWHKYWCHTVNDCSRFSWQFCRFRWLTLLQHSDSLYSFSQSLFLTLPEGWPYVLLVSLPLPLPSGRTAVEAIQRWGRSLLVSYLFLFILLDTTPKLHVRCWVFGWT